MPNRSFTDVVELLRVLGVEPPVTWAEVEQRRKTLIKVWHPDRFDNDPALQAEAQKQLSKINVAFDELAELHGRGDSWWEYSATPQTPRESPRPSPSRTPAPKHSPTSYCYPLSAASAEKLESLLAAAREAQSKLSGGTGRAKKLFMWVVGAAVLLKFTGPVGLMGLLLLAAVVGGFSVIGLAGRRERQVLADLRGSDLTCRSCKCRLIADYALGAESHLQCLIAASVGILETGACPNCGKQFAT